MNMNKRHLKEIIFLKRGKLLLIQSQTIVLENS